MADWMKELNKLEGGVDDSYNPFSNIVDTESPSLNFTFGGSWGLPKGFSVALWGPRKGGKSLITNMMAAKIHKDDPTAWVIKFNTEGRELLQFPPAVREQWGVDNKRYKCFEVNSPALVFDVIEKQLSAMIQDGMNIGLVIIDSINQIRGRRSLNADTVDTQQIGDHAATLKDGFSRILQAHRQGKFALAIVCQASAEMDKHEVMRGHTIKMNAPNAVQHYAEYFLYVEKILSKEGRVDELGNDLADESLKDVAGKADLTGHKIRVQMRASSGGVAGRTGVFTLDYKRGVINVHEEVFKLGVARGVIEKPTNSSYSFCGKKWTGKPATLAALKGDLSLQAEIVKELKKRDLEGKFKEKDQALEKALEDSPDTIEDDLSDI